MIATIKNHFSPWMNCAAWVICNPDKQPCTRHAGRYEIEKPMNYRIGELLRWKAEPQDHISNLETILETLSQMPGYGFGIFVGLHNTVVCFDFDHALDENGKIINPKVQEFVEIVGSFVEISSSGRGLHMFVNVDLVEGQTLVEYGFQKEYGDGKCYPSRFIKMTGNCLEGYDLPVRTISPREFELIRKKVGPKDHFPAQAKKTNTQNNNSKEIDWDSILDEVGIFHLRAVQYEGKTRTYPDGTIRTAIESYKIPCPNRDAHTNIERRKGKFGPDAAILTRWNDGTTSITCNHNACDPASHPNLLQMLWDEISAVRIRQARDVLKIYEGVLA